MITESAILVLTVQQENLQSCYFPSVDISRDKGVYQTGNTKGVPVVIGVTVIIHRALAMPIRIEIAGSSVEAVLPDHLGYVVGVSVVTITGQHCIHHTQGQSPGADIPGDDTVGITLPGTGVPDELGKSGSRSIDCKVTIPDSYRSVLVGGRYSNCRQAGVVQQENYIRRGAYSTWIIGTGSDDEISRISHGGEV